MNAHALGMTRCAVFGGGFGGATGNALGVVLGFRSGGSLGGLLGGVLGGVFDVALDGASGGARRKAPAGVAGDRPPARVSPGEPARPRANLWPSLRRPSQAALGSRRRPGGTRSRARRWLIVAATLAACLPALWPQHAAAAPVVLRDDRGAQVTLAAPPARIVSLLPSLTESVCALGSCARLVGTDRFSNSPASVARLPKLGGLEDAQVERIVSLKPDLVLATPGARVVERLEALGVKVMVLESRNHADVQRSLVLLAQALGTPGEAARVAQGIERDMARAAARVPAALRGQRVYFEVDPTPFAAGAGSFIGETLARLGMGNAVPAELGPFPQLNPEFVLRAQPDIVMAARRGLDDMPRRPGWKTLRALQQHRSCGFDGERYEVLVRPGPRMGEAALLLADCLASLPAPARQR
jgi:iron complex transport system substrate-binding protein